MRRVIEMDIDELREQLELIRNERKSFYKTMKKRVKKIFNSKRNSKLLEEIIMKELELEKMDKEELIQIILNHLTIK